jgi:hypothetical protein
LFDCKSLLGGADGKDGWKREKALTAFDREFWWKHTECGEAYKALSKFSKDNAINVEMLPYLFNSC